MRMPTLLRSCLAAAMLVLAAALPARAAERPTIRIGWVAVHAYDLATGKELAIHDSVWNRTSIGVGDLTRPWAGDATEVRADELPVFWACGITPQSVVLDAKPSFCITHAPGHMLVTDIENASLAAG